MDTKLWETESVVLEYLQKLRDYKAKDLPPPEPEDPTNLSRICFQSDLEWELDHIDHVMTYVEQERGKVEEWDNQRRN